MHTFWQDLRYGIRTLLKKPGFTFIAVITLALGIGANSAIFSVVSAVLLRQLPYQNPEQLVRVFTFNPKKSPDPDGASWPDFLDWRSQNTVFENIAGFLPDSFNFAGRGRPEQVQGAWVSASFFPLLGVSPIAGRAFLPEEDSGNGQHVILLSQSLWQRRFGSDPSVIGQNVTLEGELYTVVGVMPANFRYSKDADVWMPLTVRVHDWTNRSGRALQVIARLKSGHTFEQAQTEMAALGRSLQQAYPQSNTGFDIIVVNLREQIVGQVRPALLVLLGAVGFVLLMACTNIANLLLARASARQKEIVIRLALGASRGRIIRQLLTESILLSLSGGALGLILGSWAIPVLLKLSSNQVLQLNAVNIDLRVLGFTLALSLASGLIFGLVPALEASKLDLNLALKEGSKGTASAARQRFHSLLIVAEIAVAVVLLIGAGLMINSFLRLQQVSPGFDPDNLLTVSLSLPGARYPEEQRRVFLKQVLQRIEAKPGVQSVGAITILPLSGDDSSFSFLAQGQPIVSRAEAPQAEVRSVSPTYFQTMRIPLKKGRVFTERDNRSSSPVVMVNETLARRFWPNEDPIGKRLTRFSDQISCEIVGVVGDVKQMGLAAETRMEIYMPYDQSPDPYFGLVIRTLAAPENFANAIQTEVMALDPQQPVSVVKTMRQMAADSVSSQRFNTLMLTIFGVVALILATVGIYGVMSYAVRQRTQEIGIRLALGAQPRDIFKLIVGRGLWLTLVGIAAGLTASLFLTRLMSGLLFGVSAKDPLTLIGISLLLTSVAMLACYLPARRAMKVDPMVALRYE